MDEQLEANPRQFTLSTLFWYISLIAVLLSLPTSRGQLPINLNISLFGVGLLAIAAFIYFNTRAGWPTFAAVAVGVAVIQILFLAARFGSDLERTATLPRLCAVWVLVSVSWGLVAASLNTMLNGRPGLGFTALAFLCGWYYCWARFSGSY